MTNLRATVILGATHCVLAAAKHVCSLKVVTGLSCLKSSAKDGIPSFVPGEEKTPQMNPLLTKQ